MLTRNAGKCAVARPAVARKCARSAPASGKRSQQSLRSSVIAHAPANETDSHYGEINKEEQLVVRISGKKWQESDIDFLRKEVAFAGDPTSVYIADGEAVVEFGTLDEAKEAMKLQGKQLDDGTKVEITPDAK